ncbi:hypothetical protein B0H39_002569 [Clostridium beijerinckii]|nr:hypothetical protein [Clostridium beijerinckii]NOW84688.1 hypothetical protein [Clostridium beijerinckii]
MIYEIVYVENKVYDKEVYKISGYDFFIGAKYNNTSVKK